MQIELDVFSYDLAKWFHHYKFETVDEALKALSVFKTKRVRCIIGSTDGSQVYFDKCFNKG